MSKRIFLAFPSPVWAEFPDRINTIAKIVESVRANSEEDITVMRPDTLSLSNGPIMRQLHDHIATASLVIADITDQHTDVMLEVGIATGLGKPLLLLAEGFTDIPHDLKGHRFIIMQGAKWEPKFNRLAEEIAMLLQDPSAAAPNVSMPSESNHTVFISYSHADNEYLDRILVHLSPLEKNNLVELWSDRKINVGDKWRDEIEKALGRARAAILVVSADFMASEFIANDELPPLLSAAEKRGTRIIPVIAKPSRFLRDTALSRFHALNDPINPLISMHEAEREEVYAQLAAIVETEVFGR